MKKLFMITVIFALFFVACGDGSTPNNGNKQDNGNSGNDADVTGIWSANYGTDNKGEINLDISKDTWILIFKDADGTMTKYNGTWTRDGNTLTLNRSGYSSASASLSGNKLILSQSWTSSGGRPGTCELNKGGASIPGDTNKTSLKIKNQSFTEITDVIWNNVTFSNNQTENSIKAGTEVTGNVQAGSGYVFFKRKLNPIIARTSELIVVGNNEQIEFTFTENTVIVEVNNTGNSGILLTLPSTVVWWDDAEGEMQPYYLKQSFVGYYRDRYDLPYNTSTSIYLPKSGNKSIAVGGTDTALLHLRINLVKKAKLSFWYANRYYGSAGTTFSINSEEKAKWTTDINWSKIEYALEAGENNLIWKKNNGYVTYKYLSLDEILIYYTD
jgi:hypothetical protein